MSELVAIILAAGKGTRMRSKYPKVLHKVGGKLMLQHVIDAASAAGADKKVVIVGHEAELVEAMVGNQGTIALQAEQLGTGHAVMQTADALKDFHGTALILCGDTPLLDGEATAPHRTRHNQARRAALAAQDDARKALSEATSLAAAARTRAEGARIAWEAHAVGFFVGFLAIGPLGRMFGAGAAPDR